MLSLATWNFGTILEFGLKEKKTKIFSYFIIIIISNLSNGRSKASSKTIPPHSAI